VLGQQRQMIITRQEKPLHLTLNRDARREKAQVAASRRGARVERAERLLVAVGDATNVNDPAVHEEGVHALSDLAHWRLIVVTLTPEAN